MPSVALFEDDYWQSFNPITLTKATFDVKVGARSFLEEYRQCPEILLTRDYLAEVTRERHKECKVNPSSIDNHTLFVNGLLHPGTTDIDRFFRIDHTFVILSGSRLLVAKLRQNDIEYLKRCVAEATKINVKKFAVDRTTQLGANDARGLLSYPWQVFNFLDNSLAMQVADHGRNVQSPPQGVKVLGTGPVVVDKDANIEEGTILDAGRGGIYVGSDARVAPSRIVGPSFIGSKTQVKQFTIIDTSYIGYNCRVAGEIEHSILSDHTNKAHSGFLGHSYVGEWVNIGAMTTTSDLKMTYGNIKMNSGLGGKKVDTGMNKVGSFFADMCKTSVGTLVYSGRRIGVSAHLHGLVAKDVPSFTIYADSIGARSVELQLDSALETQRKVMSRREQKTSKAFEQMMKHVFAITAAERRLSKVRKGKFSI
jgi:UDP-N-acetylglucosamine diphosphorylase/glucosamine-1-phosphate N-acetyltransferase